MLQFNWKIDELTNQGLICSNEGIALVCCGEDGAELKENSRFTGPRSNPHLYGCEIWMMTERTRSQISMAETSFVGGAVLSLGDKVRGSVIPITRSREFVTKFC